MTLPSRTSDAGSSLASLLSDPERLRDFPVDTIERLVELERQFRADAAKQEFARAMHAVQGELEPVRKRYINRQTASAYAKLEDVETALAPLLSKHGLSTSTSTAESTVPGMMRVVLLVRHLAGHEEVHFLDAPIDDVGLKGTRNKTALHGLGSTLSYCRRYLLTQVFGVHVIDNDADGNAPSEPISDDQAATLSALIEETGADVNRFKRFFGIQKISELPAPRWREAVRLLEQRRGR